MSLCVCGNPNSSELSNLANFQVYLFINFHFFGSSDAFFLIILMAFFNLCFSAQVKFNVLSEYHLTISSVNKFLLIMSLLLNVCK